MTRSCAGTVLSQARAWRADSSAKVPPGSVAEIPIDRIQRFEGQPRSRFAPEEMDALTESIRVNGVLQPILVRPVEEGRYEIVAGERRWRAAQMAQLHDLPVIIKDLTDSEVLEIALIENIQRADLNAVEEALAYRQLMDRFGHTQEKMAEALSKSRSHIANLLRLLQLPDEVLGYIREGKLTAGHARALITTANPAELARMVIARGMTVRQTEDLAKKQGAAIGKPGRRGPPDHPAILGPNGGSRARSVCRDVSG
jgi:ParB family chromosome partitioning protein